MSANSTMLECADDTVEIGLDHRVAPLVTAYCMDLFSHVKERSEQHHSNYRRYFARDEDMLLSCLRAYESALRAFSAPEPERPGAALQFFRVTNQWVNGSLLWHLIASRYDDNGHRLRQFHGDERPRDRRSVSSTRHTSRSDAN